MANKIISLQQIRMEKQYKAVGSEFNYIPSLDTVKREEKRQWTAKSYQKALMELTSKLI